MGKAVRGGSAPQQGLPVGPPSLWHCFGRALLWWSWPGPRAQRSPALCLPPRRAPGAASSALCCRRGSQGTCRGRAGAKRAVVTGSAAAVGNSAPRLPAAAHFGNRGVRARRGPSACTSLAPPAGREFPPPAPAQTAAPAQPEALWRCPHDGLPGSGSAGRGGCPGGCCGSAPLSPGPHAVSRGSARSGRQRAALAAVEPPVRKQTPFASARWDGARGRHSEAVGKGRKVPQGTEGTPGAKRVIPRLSGGSREAEQQVRTKRVSHVRPRGADARP